MPSRKPGKRERAARRRRRTEEEALRGPQATATSPSSSPLTEEAGPLLPDNGTPTRQVSDSETMRKSDVSETIGPHVQRPRKRKRTLESGAGTSLQQNVEQWSKKCQELMDEVSSLSAALKTGQIEFKKLQAQEAHTQERVTVLENKIMDLNKEVADLKELIKGGAREG